MTSYSGRRILLASAGATALCLTAAAGHAQALALNDAAASAVGVEEVTITGTRVVRDGYDAPTPVTVVGEELIRNIAPNNIAEVVNQMPAVIGSTTPNNSQGAISNGAAGVNALNLRGLGTIRTLVLVDGHRSAASLATGEVDINTIPQQLVKRIDIVTGGASADYGSDAVGGVVNFILDNDYTGLKSDLQYGETTYGDNKSYKAAATAGVKFADGRGHVLLSGEFYNGDGVRNNPRPWAAQRYFTVVNPAGDKNGQPYYLSSWGVVPSQLAPGGIITSGPAKGIYFGTGGAYGRLNYGVEANPWMIGGDQVTTCLNSCGTVDLMPAEKRRNGYGRLSFEITPDVELYASASYSWARVRSNNGNNYSNVNNITLSSDNAFLPTEVRAILQQGLAPGAARTFTMGSSNQGMPLYGFDNIRENQRYLIGSQGTIHFGGAWKYDLYGAASRSNVHEEILGNFSLTRMTLAQDAVFVTAANVGQSGLPIGSIACRSTLANPANGCAPLSRIGIAGGAQSAADYQRGLDYVAYDNPYRDERLREYDVGLNVSGSPFDNWAGPVSVAFGAEWRRVSINGFVPSQFQSGWQVGNYLVTAGHYTVAEGYIETVVPVLKGMDATGALRHTDYSTSGGVNTWKLGLNYRPIEDIKFRLTYSHDIRAPNLSELFGAGTARTNRTTIDGVDYYYLQDQSGNPKLKPESANTLGLGVVLSPRFVPGLAASVDYFRIDLDKRIGTIGVNDVLTLCFVQKVSSFCDSIGTNSDPAAPPYTVHVWPINYASTRQEGIDFDVTYHVPLGDRIPGRLTLHGLATHYLRSFSDDGFSPTSDGAGVNLGGLPSWSYRADINYALDAWRVTLTGRGVSAGKVSNEYIECTGNCPVSTLQNRTINDNSIAGAFYVDGSASYDLKIGNVVNQLFFTVRNIFNRRPVIIPLGGANTAVTTSEQVQTNSSLYDVLGRTFRVGLRTSF
ncbi:TonB-dependent receptor plug domain-containing protein [Sphingomonas quercus]|uniref:TonB-dependent receptor n=1 Tax=Sphingomonas quercus TaxID=2842451 RepID=A0ABS6BJZ1_9SPHN|nr:TonB-dependent receptor [Sphingomonas quercus]MBU3077574.1 TonB-dependent receptor [Sphingomonas quercus]